MGRLSANARRAIDGASDASTDQRGADAQPPRYSKGRDLTATQPVLERWLAARLGVDRVRTHGYTYPAGAGMSNETILFSASWTSRAGDKEAEWVLRIHPAAHHRLFLDTQFRTQYDLLGALHTSGHVRVPNVSWFESDVDVLGAPFFLMERLHGRVPVSNPVYNRVGWLHDATPHQRRRLWLSAMQQLCAIHSVPVHDVQMLDGKRWGGSTPLDQQRQYWQQCIDWGLGPNVPAFFGEVGDWLERNAPPALETGLTWGDARIGNMMFDSEFDVVAVMDWEQASLAGPLLDLGWWLFFDDFHSIDNGLPRLAGLGTRDETIEFWTSTTGRTVDHLHWCEVFAGYRLSMLVVRSTRLQSGPGVRALPGLPFISRTCELLELDPPKGIE